MKYASFFSGIGGFELALDAAGFQRVFSCEIEPFCNEVFKARWGHECEAKDITKLKPEEIPDADLWVGGFPCQDLSVAGKRGGLKANRSGLVWRFLELAKVRRPHAIWLENVPGLLSSERGRDFALLLREMEELGYSCEWRVLDAQHLGVPQRRRRIFIIGHLGAECFPEILLEPQGGGGNPPKGRQKGKIASGEIARSVGGVSGGNDEAGGKGTIVAHGVSASKGHHGHSSPRGDGTDDLVVSENGSDVQIKNTGMPSSCLRDGHNIGAPIVAHAVSKSSGGGLGGRQGQDDYVVGALTSHKKKHGSEASSGQAAEAGHIVAAPLTHGSHPNSNAPSRRREDDENIVCVQDVRGSTREKTDKGQGMGVREDGKTYTLDATSQHAVTFVHQHDEGANQNHVKVDGKSDALDTAGLGAVVVPISSDALREGNARTPSKDAEGKVRLRDPGLGVGEAGAPSFAVNASTPPAVAFQSTGGSPDVQAGEKSPPIKVGSGCDIPSPPAVAFESRYYTRDNKVGGAPNEKVGITNAHKAGDSAPSLMTGMSIRRLTPTECERLQGFPDGHTCLCGVRPDCPDRRIPPWIDPATIKLGGCGHSACGCTCSDSARYRALGNAVAVPVIRWIAERMKQCLK